MRLSIVLAALVAATAPLISQQAGTVTREVQPASVVTGTKTTSAAPNEGLKINDVLKTGPDGRIRAVLNDGSILTLTSNANMKVLAHDKETGKTQLELDYGYVRASVVGAVAGQQPAPFEIHTQTSVCGVLGTQFEITTTEDATQVHVHEGQVDFTNKMTGQKMNLQRGQTAHLNHRTGQMRQGMFPKFAAATRKRWQSEQSEIAQERQERNQHRQQRAQEFRKRNAQKKRPAKQEPKEREK